MLNRGGHGKMPHSWGLICLLAACQPNTAEVPTQDLSLIDEVTSVTLPVPVGISGTEFVWEWTPHDGRFKKVQLVTAKRSKSSPGAQYSWTKTSEHNIYYTNFDDGRNGTLIIKSKFENAGHYTFKQIQPNSTVLAMFEVFAFKSVPFRWDSVPPGVDVTRVCTISRLPESSRLQWKLNGSLSAATKCHYNNTAVIIIQNVDEHSTGNYSCDLLKKETYLYGFYNRLTLKTSTFYSRYTLYRDGANRSEVQLICRSSNRNEMAQWTWHSEASSQSIHIASANRNGPVGISDKVVGQRIRSPVTVYDGYYFPLHISPVVFQDAGIYTCYTDNYVSVSITLITVQVSVEPPGVLAIGDEATLTCTVSGFRERIRLVWLRDDDGTVVTVKEETLSASASNRSLALFIPRVGTEQLKWACVVFQESLPSAYFPIEINAKEEFTDPGFVIGVSIGCVAVLFVLCFIAALVFYCNRKRAAVQTQEPVKEKPDDSAAVYSNITELQAMTGNTEVKETQRPDPREDEDKSELHYVTFTFEEGMADLNSGEMDCSFPAASNVAASNEVVYSSIKTARH
ncbi:uncharacterized protein LOC117426425 isoform X2 [Acipenser ruthenus]|uniref:uncharacterized protein LOC117426425 isoform X2 n=1 Tax=Acipenser ruthenus TaxID=7906 RepID=UPI002741C61C|nr:uncharacterized protein LOC117426425 isoform X2 [Acipenser ruthenus]